jgi:uncharacterized protein
MVVEKNTGGKMKKVWLIVASLVLIVTVAGLAGCTAGPNVSGGTLELKGSLSGQQEGIWVSGEGKVTAVPDVAIISLGIEAQSLTVAEGQTQAAAAMEKVMTALKSNGVAEKDIKTQSFSIQKVTKWDNNKQEDIFVGYRVTNMVTAKVREVAKAGAVIDAVTVAGGDLTRINSIGFTVDNPASYYTDARKLAVSDATAKAKQLAELAGVKLGKATYVTESTYVPGPIYRQDAVVKAVPAPSVVTPINPGEMEITLDVQIGYAILD